MPTIGNSLSDLSSGFGASQIIAPGQTRPLERGEQRSPSLDHWEFVHIAVMPEQAIIGSGIIVCSASSRQKCELSKLRIAFGPSPRVKYFQACESCCRELMPHFPDEGPKPVTAHALRVALFVHAFFPEHIYGTESYTLALARQLQALGHSPVVITAVSPGEPPQMSEVERYTVGDIPVLRIDRNLSPPRNAREEYDMPALAPLLERLLREIRPDVAHVCHLGNFSVVLPQVTEALGIPTFATLTDFFNLCLNSLLQLPDGGLCAGPDARRLNCMTCGILMRRSERPSPFWAALAHPAVHHLAALAGTRLAPLLPPPLGTDARAVIRRPKAFTAAMGRYQAAIAPTRYLKDTFEANGVTLPLVHSAFGIDIDRRPKPPAGDRPVRFGFIGQILMHKGPHLLLQALRLLPVDAFTLDIWGSDKLYPDYARDLRSVAGSMPVTFNAPFAEHRMAEVLSQVDVLVLPSTWFENGPLTLLKALATHTPVVVSDVPGMTEFIQEGIDGFAFPRGDVDALAAVLRRFVEAPDLARRMSAATAYPRTERAMALEVLDLYARFGGRPAPVAGAA
ncbi:glycosyltransferase [Xanthobacter sp. DSM 14520]|uniref:glycosyltransferase n=1 Tax=Xanthobacter autotrophicus (strain ATCC BAA-1158 / Py2) TaxID=78245 RepID=UPI00372C0D84